MTDQELIEQAYQEINEAHEISEEIIELINKLIQLDIIDIESKKMIVQKMTAINNIISGIIVIKN